MSFFVKINKETGKILAKYNIPFESAARQNKEINEELIEINELSYLEINDVNGFVFDDNKSITNLGKKPNDYSEFNWQTKQWEDSPNIAKQQVLTRRQQLLAASDWTDTVSAQTRLPNYEEWQTYRQALRDITKQEGYPLNVVWPTQPN